MSGRSRLLGLFATLAPSHKLEATGAVAGESGLVRPGQVRAFVRTNAAFVWSYYLRFALLACRRVRMRTCDRVTTLGEEHLSAAVAEGTGLILLSVHLGDFDAGGAWLVERHGVTPVVIARPLKPGWRQALFSCVRRRCGVVLRDPGSTSLEELERDLARGRAVLAMLDRRVPGPTSPSRLLGRPAVAPLAVALLAARSGAPLLPAATWRDGGGSLIAWFGEPFTAARPEQAMARISEVAGQLGELIRAHPAQWHVPADLAEMPWAPPEASMSVASQDHGGLSLGVAA